MATIPSCSSQRQLSNAYFFGKFRQGLRKSCFITRGYLTRGSAQLRQIWKLWFSAARRQLCSGDSAWVLIGTSSSRCAKAASSGAPRSFTAGGCMPAWRQPTSRHTNATGSVTLRLRLENYDSVVASWSGVGGWHAPGGGMRPRPISHGPCNIAHACMRTPYP
jgi:hypothetical protein